jgi:hypothetical protein
MPAKGIFGWIVGDDLFTCQIVKKCETACMLWLATDGWALIFGEYGWT